MRSVKNKTMLVRVFVYPNITVILMKAVVLSVQSIPIVTLTKRVWRTNAKIPARELVAAMLNVRLLTTFQCVHVCLVTLETHSNIVRSYRHNVSRTF